MINRELMSRRFILFLKTLKAEKNPLTRKCIPKCFWASKKPYRTCRTRRHTLFLLFARLQESLPRKTVEYRCGGRRRCRRDGNTYYLQKYIIASLLAFVDAYFISVSYQVPICRVLIHHSPRNLSAWLSMPLMWAVHFLSILCRAFWACQETWGYQRRLTLQ